MPATAPWTHRRCAAVWTALLAAPLALGCSSLGPSASPGRALPASFEAGLVFVQPVTAAGHPLRFLTDTGGGYFVFAEHAERAGLFRGEPPEAVRVPQWAEGSWLPAPDDGRLPVWDPPQSGSHDERMSGMLGAPWFAGREWQIDYGRERFSTLLDWRPTALELEASVPLYFQEDDAGRATTGFPRVQATVAGEELGFLLDTGAQVRLTPRAAAELADGLGELRATSFVAASIFDRWRAEHPDWRVVPSADANLDGEPMILVPTVGIGDCEGGPVWFTRRPDRNFTEYMAQWMDQPVVGALGGSVLAAFRVTISYPRQLLLLEPATSNRLGVSAQCRNYRARASREGRAGLLVVQPLNDGPQD